MINITGWYHIVSAWLTIVAKLSLNRNFRVNQILKIFSEYDLDNYCLFLPQGGIPILRNKITWRTTEAQGCNWTILYDYEVIWTVYNPFLQPFWSILVYLGLPWATSGYLDLTRAITAISVYLGPSCSVSGYITVTICNDRLSFATFKGIRGWKLCFGTDSITPMSFWGCLQFWGSLSFLRSSIVF